MKKEITAIISVLTLSHHVCSSIEPVYKVNLNARDPFVKSGVKVKPGSVSAAIQAALEVQLKIKGVMRGGDGKLIGIFSKGMFKEGDTVEIDGNGTMVEVTLEFLDMDKISAVFRSGDLVYKVRKEN